MTDGIEYISPPVSGAGASGDHGDLTGLGDDDHPQYETSAEAAAKVTTHTALPDAHHAKSHVHDGADGSGTVAHSATTGKTADDHHAQAHAAAHLPNAADALAWSASIHQAGVAASRPAAAAGNAGCLYFATDTGALWRSTGSAWARMAFSHEALYNGNIGYRESISRWAAISALSVLTSGIMYLVGIPLYAGDVVTSLTFISGTGLTMGSNVDGHLFFALYDPGAANLLSQSADQGGAATWSSNAVKTLALSAPQTIAATGLHYAALMVNTGTGGSPVAPQVKGTSVGAAIVVGGASWPTGVKLLAGTNATGLTTTAPAGPLTITGNVGIPYCLAT